MSEPVRADSEAVDLGEFCRRVEEHLARVNEGQLVRVVGPAFELVRAWALDGVPLSIVCHGINLKAERHHAGGSRHPLRLEFCRADVQDAHARWRRAVGLSGSAAGAGQEDDGASKKPSLARHLDRAADRLSRAAGRLDLPDAFRERLSALLEQVAALREAARSSRGAARVALAARLPDLDRALLDAAGEAISREQAEEFRTEAATELAAYRSRLSPEAWTRSVEAGASRLIRDHLGLPTLTCDD